MLENWLFPQLNQDSDEYTLQQDGAPPHFNREVREVLNRELPQRWIGSRGPSDNPFFLWGYVEDTVNVPPLSRNLQELQNKIVAALGG
jgi:hypothetical protein